VPLSLARRAFAGSSPLRLGPREGRAVHEGAGRVRLVIDAVGAGDERAGARQSGEGYAAARASSRFRPPRPRPLTVTVVSPPKIVTEGRR